MFHIVYSRHYWNHDEPGQFTNTHTIMRNVPYDNLHKHSSALEGYKRTADKQAEEYAEEFGFDAPIEKELEPGVISINEDESGIVTDEGILQINGCSYIEGLDDYEWYFAIRKENLQTLWAELKEPSDADSIDGEEFMLWMKREKKRVSDFQDVCVAKEIPHAFQNFM